MHGKRRHHKSAFKAKIALESLKCEMTIAQIGSECSIHSNQIHLGRDSVLEVLSGDT